MSDNDRVRELYEALATGDAAGLNELLHPEFVGRTTEGLPLELGGTFAGPEKMRKRFWWRIGEHYRARAEPEDFISTDDGRLLVLGRYVGEGRRSGSQLDAAFAHLFTFKDGRISALVQVTDTTRWAHALGSEPSAVEFQFADGLAHIRLNRPEVRNALDHRTAAELREVVRRCAETDGLRAVLLTGAGPTFTLGGDLDFFGDADETARPDILRRSAGLFHEALRTLLSLDAPIVCAVQGAAAGGGLGLLYCADVVLAAESARFALGFGAVGLSSDGGNSWFLPRLVGLRRAAELYFEGRVLTAAEAADWGLISRAVPDEALQDEAWAVARKLAAGPTRAYAEMRHLMRGSWDRDVSSQFTAEEQALARTGATADAAEGISAFRDKRATKFQGR